MYPDGKRVPVNRSNLLLRGCVLRNTEAVIGIVAYAGLSVCLSVCVCTCILCLCVACVYVPHVCVSMCATLES